MTKLEKHPSAELKIVREFVPRDSEVARSAGTVVVRTENYVTTLAGFNKLFEVISQDMATFDPPIELDEEDVTVVHYAGQRYRGTYGLEVHIPEGHLLPDNYTETHRVESTLG